MACETLVTTGLCLLAGEITTDGYVDLPAVARETIREIGYTDAALRLRLRDLRGAVSDRRAVAGHRAWGWTPAAPATRG